MPQAVEVIDDALAEPIELMPLGVLEAALAANGLGEPRSLRVSLAGYAYRSLKEVVTGLELCQRLYPSLPGLPATALIGEGNQISRMAHRFIQRLGTSTESPAS